MKRPLLRTALATVLLAGALAAQPGGPAASADTPTGWFGIAATSAPEAAPVVSEREFIQTRLARFDATGAVQELVSPTDLVASEIISRQTVKPLKDRLVVVLADGVPATVVVDQVAVGVTQDIGPQNAGTIPALASVEVQGHVGAAGTAQAVVAFVFVPDTDGNFRMSGTIDNSPRDMATSIVPISDDTYALGVFTQSGRTAPDEPPGGGGAEDDGNRNPDPLVPRDLKAYVNGKTMAETKAGAPVVTVDLGIAYANGNSADIVLRARQMVADTNTALSRSQVNVQLDLLFTQAVDYVQDAKDPNDPEDEADLGDDFDALKLGSGALRAVHTRRTETGVDLVALLVPQSNTACGLAQIPLPGGGDSDARWSVTAADYGCSAKWTFSHEIGHNLGGNHHPTQTGGNARPFDYARGHRVEGKERDLMAYDCPPPEAVCKRGLEFSNPDVPFIRYPDLPSGTADRNNARSMRNLSAVVAGYDTRKPAWDVPGTDPFSTQIRWSVDQGLLTCGADLAFRKTDPVNRGAMAAIAYRRSGSPAYTPPGTSPFSDVPKTHIFYKVITWANSKGIMTGYQNGTFGPSDLVTRGQTAVVAYNLMGKPAYTAPQTSPFPDVATTAYYYKAIMWMVDNHVANGYDSGNFGPNDDVQRGQMSVFLHNMRSMTTAA